MGAAAVLWPGGAGKEEGVVVFSPSWGPRQDPLGWVAVPSLLEE